MQTDSKLKLKLFQQINYAPTKAEARDAPIPDINEANFLFDFAVAKAGRFSSSSFSATTSGTTTASSFSDFEVVSGTSSFTS